jgi:hypothetical protein
VRCVLPPRSAFVLFEREGGGGGEDLATRVWRSGIDSATPNARRGQIARSKAGSSEVFVFRGLSRVGTTPIRSGACRRHIFLKIAKAGAEVPAGPCTGCCRTKPRNFVATTALVDRSSKYSAHQLVGPTPVPLLHRQLATEVCTKRAGHGRPRARTGHKTVLKHVFDANLPFAGLVNCHWPMPLHGLAAAGPFRWECFFCEGCPY